MDAPPGIFRVRLHGQAVDFQVEGRATAAQSAAFRKCAEHCLADGAHALHIDLGRCTYMDSTFLGTLLFLRRAVERYGPGEFALVCPSPQCCQILGHMGMANIFPTRATEEAETGPWVEVTGDLQDVCAFKRNVIQAHRELAALPGPAGEPFRAVVRSLAQEPEAQDAESSASA
jgi:anti-anti-sigma factor